MKCPPFTFLLTEFSFMATILQSKVAKRRLFEKVSLERCYMYTETEWIVSSVVIDNGICD